MGTIREIRHEECTGCGACYNKCPHNAIRMEYDSEGFLFPVIDDTLCVDCGLCLQSCAVKNPQYNNNSNPECYAMWADDEIRMVSSSGGMFTVLANYVLEKDGYVCGAAYTDDYTAVEHIVISDKNDLPRLRGSKYVQSNTKRVYSEIKTLLDENKLVLFSGCPCQVAGIYAYLGKDYDNLYTADLVCHGVPSQKAFKKFVQEKIEANGPIKYMNFRDKSFGGWNVSTVIKHENEKSYKLKRNECYWLNSFLKLISIRKSCGKCKFATIPRQGDFTLADFWDVNRLTPEYDDKKGTSLVLVNNEKAFSLVPEIIEQTKLFEKSSLEHAKKYNSQLHSSSLLNNRRQRFFDLLDIYDFDKAVDYGLNRRFDIGYVGWWYGLNYGSALTNFAMHEVLTKKLKKTVLMIDWPAFSDSDRNKPNTATRRFANHFYETSLRYTFEETKKMNYHCETFLVGSDQLWNWYSTKEMGQYFFLDFADDKHKRIAYATSFGHAQSFFQGEEKLKVAYNLKKFDAISVREKDGVKICEDEFGVKAAHTLDPVFLCPKESYEQAIKLSKRIYSEKYLLAYILNPTKEKYNIIKEKANDLGIKYKIILDAQAEKPEENKKAFDFDENIQDNLEIADWLWLFKNSEFIVTDSYHGFCYSIIFHKQFVCFLNELRGNSRFNSLSELLCIEQFLVNDAQDIKVRNLDNKVINYDFVEERLEKERNRSMEWLSNALKMPHKNATVDELLYDEILNLKKDLKYANQEIEKLKVFSLKNNQKVTYNQKIGIFKKYFNKFVVCVQEEGIVVAAKKSINKVKCKYTELKAK
ncbi:MAG: polysaccharide pyruvyl transferase family protein [Peptococcaceae bacterium]|nr:polysaccharide pyruvyl transferase family protein [Peptococcaceae bacterium]